MNKAPADVAKEIKRLERRSRQLHRSIGALRQAIDVLREHEAFQTEVAPTAHRTLHTRGSADDFAASLGEEANDDARHEREERAAAPSEKSFPA